MTDNNCTTSIPPEIDNVLVMAASYIKDETGDWMTVKRMLLLILPYKFRMFFSTRDPHTKEQRLNEFEHSVIARWKDLTGVDLVLVADRCNRGRQ